MPDSPVHAQNLTQEERIAALERVRDDQGGTENKTFKMDQVKETLLDVRTWLIVLTTMLSERLFNCFRGHTLLSANTASIPNGGLSNCVLIRSPILMFTT